MLTNDMIRKMNRREFDPPNYYHKNAKAVLHEQALRILELWDTGKYSKMDVARMVGVAPSTVLGRIRGRAVSIARQAAKEI